MKKSTIFIPVIIATMITSHLDAQDSIFDLKSYKTTNYERSSLDLKFNLNEDAIFSKSESSNSLYKSKNMNVNSGFQLGSEYSKIIYSQKRIVNYSSSVNLSDSFKSATSGRADGTDSNPSKQFSYLGDHQVFFNYNSDNYYSAKNKNYFKLGGNASAGIHNEMKKSGVSGSLQSSYSDFDARISLTFGHGHGRIENVEDAVEAMYILNELSENGLLSKKYTGSDVKALADKITLVKKERFFDERLYRQKSMKSLVSLLEESGLISDGNIDVFNTIADYHYFAGINERPSGQKFEYYLTPYFSYSNTVNKTEELDGKQLSDNYSGYLDFFVNYSNCKPISIKWQRNIFAGTNLVYGKGKKVIDNYSGSSETNNTNYISGGIQAGLSYGYYPSTRSNITLGLNAGYNYFVNNHEEQSTKYRNGNLNANVNINGYYYLSQQLRLSGTFYLRPFSSDNETFVNDILANNSKSQNVSNNLIVALTYYLF